MEVVEEEEVELVMAVLLVVELAARWVEGLDLALWLRRLEVEAG